MFGEEVEKDLLLSRFLLTFPRVQCNHLSVCVCVSVCACVCTAAAAAGGGGVWQLSLVRYRGQVRSFPGQQLWGGAVCRRGGDPAVVPCHGPGQDLYAGGGFCCPVAAGQVPLQDLYTGGVGVQRWLQVRS